MNSPVLIMAPDIVPIATAADNVPHNQSLYPGFFLFNHVVWKKMQWLVTKRQDICILKKYIRIE
jgi:hypothetical protein